MLKASKTTLCIQCRRSTVPNSALIRGIKTSPVLHRGKAKQKPRPTPRPSLFDVLVGRGTQHSGHSRSNGNRTGYQSNSSKSTAIRRPSTPDQVRFKLNEGMYKWALLPATRRRLLAMGIPGEHVHTLLQSFVDERPKTASGWFPPEEDGKWQMSRIQDDLLEHTVPASIDKALTRRFMAWALETCRTRGIVPSSVYNTLVAVQNALDYTHPEEWYPTARMLRRKIHMHVGPTNSGKTHNALRALAAAERGVYCSPLRLLAYEVFDRLNKGQIVPINADPSAPQETFKRACNLTTGEEVRIIHEDAPLMSCTVEMMDLIKRHDVAVIDEIQMIADPDRGGAWSQAVLGLHAKEVHLCGEAGAVPLVQEMLKDTGDELIVHRYERLTPLRVASQSLKGDLHRIQKGDCVVSFSRTMLFDIKKRIEEETGMKCAIIYGRLPPEVRCEQAELFNDPYSGYDVLVGSDAIGMGLNLKIKRIVFESCWKFDGEHERVLSLSQLKQIAGRAGRYGMHGESEAPGIVTTLNDFDLEVVRKAVESRFVPLAKRAVLPVTSQMFHRVEQLIWPSADFFRAFDLIRTASVMPPHFALEDLDRAGADVLPIITMHCSDWTLEERLRVMQAPVQWQDEAVRRAMEEFLKKYKKDMHVKFLKTVKDTQLMQALEKVQKLMRGEKEKGASASGDEDGTGNDTNSIPDDVLSFMSGDALSAVHAISEQSSSDSSALGRLLKLESLYRIAVIYMWFSMRMPLVFSDRDEAVKVKEQCEEAIEWCLLRVHAEQDKRREKIKQEKERMMKLERMNSEREQDEKKTDATQSDADGAGGDSTKAVKEKASKQGTKSRSSSTQPKPKTRRIDGLDDTPPRQEHVELLGQMPRRRKAYDDFRDTETLVDSQR